MVKRFEDFEPKKVIRRRISYNNSLFPLGLILAIILILLGLFYFSLNRVTMSGMHYVMFFGGSIVSWFYWLIVILIAIIIWKALD